VAKAAFGATTFGVSASALSQSFTVDAAEVDYKGVRSEIASRLDSLDYDDGSYGPILIRLAWHSSGSYSKFDGTGGSNNATMRFSPEREYGGNAGLGIARDFLEPVKAKYPGISYADLWTLAGVVAVEEMGGPTIEWRPGRVDSVDNSPTAPDDRLPDAAQGVDHVREVGTRLGFTDREWVALIGAHCFGRCHTDRSGFDGPWTFAPTTFSNMYFTELLKDQWSFRNWNGPAQYEDPTKSLMMLPADYALKTDPAYRAICEEFAADEAKFAQEFAPAFSKLLHNGCDSVCGTGESSYLGLAALGALASLIAVKNQ
jgi:cytochrome c peroxidase